MGYVKAYLTQYSDEGISRNHRERWNCGMWLLFHFAVIQRRFVQNDMMLCGMTVSENIAHR